VKSIEQSPLAVRLFGPRLEFLEVVLTSAVPSTGLEAVLTMLTEHRDRVDASPQPVARMFGEAEQVAAPAPVE